MYALAYDANSIALLLLGRLCCGLGSARAVNRRYISDCVPLRIRMQASAGFVSASALGMACGPTLAGLLQIKFKIYQLTFNQSTLPGWVMAVAWLFYLVWLFFLFKEPLRDTEEKEEQETTSMTDREENNRVMEEGLRKLLLITSGLKLEDEDDCHESEESAEDSRRPANSLGDAYLLLTPSVKVQLLIYFMLKYSMEILLSDSSVVTSYYFGWTTSSVAIFLACLGLTVLPINILVGSYISNMFEDRQILLTSEIIVFIGILVSFNLFVPYTVPQYVIINAPRPIRNEVVGLRNKPTLSKPIQHQRIPAVSFTKGVKLTAEQKGKSKVVTCSTVQPYPLQLRNQFAAFDLGE